MPLGVRAWFGGGGGGVRGVSLVGARPSGKTEGNAHLLPGNTIAPVSGDETAVSFPIDLGSRPSNRTSLSTSFKIHGGV